MAIQCVRVTPPSPLPHARTTRCWGDPTCWSEHPQSPFSPSRSCWAALSAPNPWHFSSNLEILLFFFINMFIFPIFSFFHPKLATEKPSQGCPSPGRVLPAAAPLCPMEHPGVERCWPRSPHPAPEFSTLRCFLRGLQSHLHGATALPTPTVSVQHGASTAGWCCLCPTAACGHVPTGSPPGLSGGLAAPGGQQVPSALPKSRGGILVWSNWGGCVLARVLLETLRGHITLWATHSPITPTPLPSQQWEDGDLGKVLPNLSPPQGIHLWVLFSGLG